MSSCLLLSFLSRLLQKNNYSVVVAAMHMKMVFNWLDCKIILRQFFMFILLWQRQFLVFVKHAHCLSNKDGQGCGLVTVENSCINRTVYFLMQQKLGIPGTAGGIKKSKDSSLEFPLQRFTGSIPIATALRLYVMGFFCRVWLVY